MINLSRPVVGYLNQTLVQRLRRGRAVARAAGVSHAFLYNHPQLRGRIEHLRTRHLTPRPPNTGDPDNNLLLALTAKIDRLRKQHRTEVQALRTALERAHGENLDLRRELTRRGWTPNNDPSISTTT
jgi:predicted Zn-dependent protease